MEVLTRIERSLDAAFSLAEGEDGPPTLGKAMRYAVFPGGARIRPRLTMAVAAACGDDRPELTDATAAAIELLHCASLVHDDLPCFDDAPLRRGKPSVHKAFGEQIAILAGDALIVLAFQSLAAASNAAPQRLGRLLLVLGRAVGAPRGITAGQAWECEPQIALEQYQQAKTGALFAAATAGGACAAGQEPGPWYALGERLGAAYQIADDLLDVAASTAELGKPTGQDLARGRPNAVHELGFEAAADHLEKLLRAAIDAVPPCPGADTLRAHIRAEAAHLKRPTGTLLSAVV